MADLAALEELIGAEAEAEGLKLVRVKMIGGTSDPTLQIMAEDPKTRQLTLEDCARLSRRISEMLDTMEAEGRDPFADAYRLEVSSPGIDRPLTRIADFDDWKGHDARIVLAEKLEGRKVFTGPLLGAEGQTVMLDVPGIGATGLPFDMIHSAKLVMTDRLIAATAPISAEGADEVVELEDQADADANNDIDTDIEAEED